MPVDRATRQAWLVWTVAVAVYMAAVFHRASLGVAGLQAAARFGVFTVLQVGVYAAMQVPTGMLVDRFGPRRVLTVAAVLLGLGQLLFAVATTYPLGLAARAVVGLGDAMTFVAVLRLVAAHFPARTYPLVVSLTAGLGAAGNLASTVPLTLALDGFGWTWTFLGVGVATMAYAGLAGSRLRNAPEGAKAAGAQVPLRTVLRQALEAWRVPGTRLGFWVHFSTMSAPTVLGLLWGFPYLVRAQGLAPRPASMVLGVLVIGQILGNPLVGTLVGRRPELRMPLVSGYLVLATGVWATLLGWPGGRVPLALIVPTFAVLSLGGPVSAIAFALARDYNPVRRVGTATGVANVGGFVATTTAALGVGVLLGLVDSWPPATGFRVALLSVAAVLLLGISRVAVWWRRARAAVFQAEARGESVPVQLRRRRWDAPVPAEELPSAA